MIHIFYRHYNVAGRENWRPHWFDYEKCWLNLYNKIKNNQDIKLSVIFDGDIFGNFITRYDYDNLFKINCGNDLDSFKKTLTIINSLSDKIKGDDVVYLLENDYLHQNGWIEVVNEFFSTNLNKNYLSLYDHNDKYSDSYSDLKSKIYVTKNHHFRTTPSTCGSFLMKKKVFDEDYEFNLSIFDYLLNKTNLPVDHAKFLVLDKIKNRQVLTALPGLSTHCLDGLMSPTINWEKISNE